MIDHDPWRHMASPGLNVLLENALDQHQNERRSYLVAQELLHGNLSFTMLSEFRPIVGDGFVIR